MLIPFVHKSQSLARSVVAWVSIDSAIAPLLVGRLWSLLAGPLTPLFIVTFTTPTEQGLFYTFGSVLAIQGLFELGFNQVLQQFISHERPFLNIKDGKLRGGSRESLKRTQAYFRIGLIWYGSLSLLVLAVIGFYGNYFFSTQGGVEVGWRFGWWLLVASAALNVLLQPFVLVVNGLDFVAFVNRWRTVTTILQTIALWGSLAAGLSTSAPGVSALVGAVLLPIPFFFTFFPLFRALARNVKQGYIWPTFVEVFQLQTKTAMSWMTGYFVYQTFTPILLVTTDATRVGQFGMTQAVLASAATFPLAWVQTKFPRIGASLAVGDFDSARETFKASFIRATVLSLPSLIGAYLLLLGLQFFMFKEQRILNIPEGVLLIFGFAAQNIVMAFGGYVRAHKADPFVLVSWTQAIVTVCSVWYLSASLSVTGAALAFFLSWLLALAWVTLIFLRFWNNPANYLPAKLSLKQKA